jgi:SH3-like domain-containing protein
LAIRRLRDTLGLRDAAPGAASRSPIDHKKECHRMNLLVLARTIAATALLHLALSSPVLAQQMVSVRGETVNMRQGPSTGTEVLWELGRGYPLRVIARKGDWLHVRDFEGDQGWVSRPLTSRTPHHIVKSKVANVRSGPGTQYRIVGKVEYGTVLRTEQTTAQWVKVRREGGQRGWISRSLLWGW